MGSYAGGGGVSNCPGAAGGSGSQQGQPAQGPCPSSQSGKAGTEIRGGEGGSVRVVRSVKLKPENKIQALTGFEAIISVILVQCSTN